MESRHKKEMLIAIAILIALVIIIWLLLRPEPQIIEEPVPSQPVETEITGEPAEIPEITKEPVDIAAQTIARTFAERFGSYSSQGDFANVTDVMSIATEALKDRLESIAASAQASASDEYQGMSTRVLSMETTSETEEVSVVEIQTQRTESIGSPANSTTTTQKLTLSLIKSGNSWLVDDFTWE